MAEKTTLEIIAPTVEEAISQGLAQLGLTADAVSVEVLDTGNKGLFGLGKPQVRVRLTVVPPGGNSRSIRWDGCSRAGTYCRTKSGAESRTEEGNKACGA